MTLTRWKLLAGVLGISIVGVVAMANPQCPGIGKKEQTRETAPPLRTVAATTTPTTPLPMPKAELPTPSWSPGEPVPFSVQLPLPAVAPAKPELTTPTLPMLTPTPTTPALPQVELPTVVALAPPLPPATTLPPIPNSAPLDLPAPPPVSPKPDRVIELPLPTVSPVKPSAPVLELKLDLPEVKPEPKPLPTPVVTKPAVVTAEPPLAKPVPEQVKKIEEPVVRVVIHLGTGQPKFDVMSGDDVLLKAVCDNVDIRSPSTNGAGVTPLKAGGKVRFTAPGCEGTCDNLTVLPSTGEVELGGNVKVHCRMGKGETEINAATLKFKLGSAPAYTVPEPPVTAASARVP